MLINSTNKIKLNIIFQSSDKLALYNYKIKVENTLKRSKYLYKITYFPTKTKRYSILRSPHIYKKSIETYNEKIYSLKFDILISDLINYKNIFYLIKFFKNNIPLNINILFKLKNNVKTNILTDILDNIARDML